MLIMWSAVEPIGACLGKSGGPSCIDLSVSSVFVSSEGAGCCHVVSERLIFSYAIDDRELCACGFIEPFRGDDKNVGPCFFSLTVSGDSYCQWAHFCSWVFLTFVVRIVRAALLVVFYQLLTLPCLSLDIIRLSLNNLTIVCFNCNPWIDYSLKIW